MHVRELPEISQLSTPEKILLVEEIWESIIADEHNIPIPESHIQELKKRLKSYESAPGNLLSLEELQLTIEDKK